MTKPKLIAGSLKRNAVLINIPHMKKTLLLVTISFLASVPSFAQEQASTQSPTRTKKWQIEPLKITSLMVNTHPEYNGWGFEAARRITDKLWVTSMIEKTKGGDFQANFDPAYDFLVTFDYFAWLNTLRYHLKPDAKYTTFFDGGMAVQSAQHKFLRNDQVFEERAVAVGPLLLVGGQLRLRENIYFKWRAGLVINAYRGGSLKSRIDDGQDQPPFFLYPHLTDALLKPAMYVGDVAFGVKV